MPAFKEGKGITISSLGMSRCITEGHRILPVNDLLKVEVELVNAQPEH
ncbi:MAG: hypothetical protein JW902_00090 [Syntrophaceae bacterium]|nr:hypothetical protein [Syntrophaceae bacterium]